MAALRLPANARLWAAIGLMFVVALFGAVPATQAWTTEAHVDHHVTASGELDHLSAVAHDHIESAAPQSPPDMVAETLLQRLRVTLPALGLIFAVGVLWLLSPQHFILAGRDPPRRPPNISPGRVVLTRLCISRR